MLFILIESKPVPLAINYPTKIYKGEVQEEAKEKNRGHDVGDKDFYFTTYNQTQIINRTL